tara:strand:- start:614 stop:763 length:150 start_codon:yes stop_codon:yes gene_type:complete
MENTIMKVVALTTGMLGMAMCYLIGYVHAKIESSQSRLEKMMEDIDKVN